MWKQTEQHIEQSSVVLRGVTARDEHFPGYVIELHHAAQRSQEQVQGDYHKTLCGEGDKSSHSTEVNGPQTRVH